MEMIPLIALKSESKKLPASQWYAPPIMRTALLYKYIRCSSEKILISPQKTPLLFSNRQEVCRTLI